MKLDNYDMTLPPGRSYRYYTGTPLFTFGQGMSYTEFGMSCTHRYASASSFPITVTCTVINKGNVSGDEVVQLYHSVGKQIRAVATHPIPLKSLVDFQRVSLQPQASVNVVFKVDETAFSLVTNDGTKTVYRGEHAMILSRGVGDDQVLKVDI